jgi:hypothetical protein
METQALPIEDRVRQAAKALQSALRGVLNATPAAWNGPNELLRILGVQASLGSRLLGALSQDDPLATLMRLPKSNGLKLVLRGAARAKAPPELIEEATRATREIENLVRFSGGQGDFDTMLAGWLPEGRMAFELRNRQAAFRAMSNLRGLAADVILSTNFVHPAADPERCDEAKLIGPVGLRRLRPGAEVQVTSTRVLEPDPTGPPDTTLDGRALDEEPASSALVEFCEPSPPRVRCVRQGLVLQRILAGNHVGPESRCTLVFGEARRNARHRHSAPDRSFAGGSETIDIPARTLILDFLIHEDVWPGCEPELRVYGFSALGPADPNNPSRDIDRQRVPESIQYLGRGVSGFGVSEVGRYVEMIRHVGAKLKWDIERFRGFRCRMPYPVYATQVCMVFKPPLASMHVPASSALRSGGA